jgi:amino acid transporter
MHRHTFSANAYPESYYDDRMCLKPPLLLWLAVIYLSRAVTPPFLMAIGHFAGVDSRAISAVRGYWSLDSLIPSLIAAVILLTLFRRVPSAPRPVRRIWARGHIFLAVSAILDIGLQAIAAIRQGEINNLSLLSAATAVVDLYFLVYILAARRVRHVFSEFPDR